MSMTQSSVVVGVFTDPDHARQAIDELRRAGYGENEIGYLTRASTADTPEATQAHLVNDAAGGGIIGGVLGAAVALLIPGIGPAIAGGILVATLGGAAIGAAAGGLIGILTRMGLEEQEATFYQQELEAGHTIITVKSSSQDEALAILRRNGAYDAKSHDAVINTNSPPRSLGTSGPPDPNEPGPGPVINTTFPHDTVTPEQ